MMINANNFVKCAGPGILPFEFICKRCLNANSDDSAADEDYDPTSLVMKIFLN